MRKPQQSRSKDSTDQMVSAALSLIEEGGLEAATVAAVAARSGQSNGALFHRFGNRTGLLVAAGARLLDQVEQSSQREIEYARNEPDDLAALKIVARSYMVGLSSHGRAVRAFMVEGQDIEALHTQGRVVSQRIQHRVIDWMVGRFGCATQAAAVAVYMFNAAALSRALFSETHFMAERIPVETLIDALAGNALRLVT